jgi:group I intron endonuclease
MGGNMEIVSGIYQIRNIINNKVYVGSAVNFIRRKAKHFCELRQGIRHNDHFQSSFDLYGELNFSFEILEYIENINYLLEREDYWIDFLDSTNRDFGYNVRLTAKNNLGMKSSEETKTKQSISGKGRVCSEQTKQKIGEKNSGKHPSEEAREKMRISHLGQTPSKETREKLSIFQKKRFQSEDARNEISLSLIGKKKILNTSSKYVGVCLDKSRNKWVAYIGYNGKRINIGSYNTEIDAALAYNAKALELYGENARLNIIIEDKEDNE